jgi:hypothetical protein
VSRSSFGNRRFQKEVSSVRTQKRIASCHPEFPMGVIG